MAVMAINAYISFLFIGIIIKKYLDIIGYCHLFANKDKKNFFINIHSAKCFLSIKFLFNI